MPNDIVAVKKILRTTALAFRSALSDQTRQRAAIAIAERSTAFATPPGRIFSGFVALKGEIDATPLMVALARRGARLCLPRVGRQGLAFHAYRPGDELVSSSFGVMEPLGDAPLCEPEVMLVPLLAFDRCGNRLGYGMGFYDRAIASRPGVSTIGVAFTEQELAKVPVTAADQPLDYILTEAGLIDCRAVRGE